MTKQNQNTVSHVKKLIDHFADLRLVIGSFLLIVGLLLLGTHFFGPSDLVQGVRLNLGAGLAMGAVGIFLLALGIFAVEQEED